MLPFVPSEDDVGGRQEVGGRGEEGGWDWEFGDGAGGGVEEEDAEVVGVCVSLAEVVGGWVQASTAIEVALCFFIFELGEVDPFQIIFGSSGHPKHFILDQPLVLLIYQIAAEAIGDLHSIGFFLIGECGQ
jgi:hypothetical protein